MRIGVDLVEIKRLRRSFDSHDAFGPMTFTEGELEAITTMGEQQKSEFLAGRFAVKEAVMKALGSGMTGAVTFTEIECLTQETGEPVLRLVGEALRRADTFGLTQFAVSISHEAGLAVAVVVLS
jgi:holo-[acyl-carrier protein] synthase